MTGNTTTDAARAAQTYVAAFLPTADVEAVVAGLALDADASTVDALRAARSAVRQRAHLTEQVEVLVLVADLDLDVGEVTEVLGIDAGSVVAHLAEIREAVPDAPTRRAYLPEPPKPPLAPAAGGDAGADGAEPPGYAMAGDVHGDGPATPDVDDADALVDEMPHELEDAAKTALAGADVVMERRERVPPGARATTPRAGEDATVEPGAEAEHPAAPAPLDGGAAEGPGAPEDEATPSWPAGGRFVSASRLAAAPPGDDQGAGVAPDDAGAVAEAAALALAEDAADADADDGRAEPATPPADRPPEAEDATAPEETPGEEAAAGSGDVVVDAIGPTVDEATDVVRLREQPDAPGEASPDAPDADASTTADRALPAWLTSRRAGVVALAVLGLGLLVGIATRDGQAPGREAAVACPDAAPVCVEEVRVTDRVSPEGDPGEAMDSLPADGDVVLWWRNDRRDGAEGDDLRYAIAWTDTTRDALLLVETVPVNATPFQFVRYRLPPRPGMYVVEIRLEGADLPPLVSQPFTLG